MRRRRIVAFAADSAAILAEYLEYQLSILGLPIVAVTTAGGMTHLARVVKKRDVVIAISFQRGLRQTVEGARAGSRARRLLHRYFGHVSCRRWRASAMKCFSHRSKRHLSGASYTAPISLVDAIIATCGQYRRPLTWRLRRKSPKNSARACAGTTRELCLELTGFEDAERFSLTVRRRL